MSKYPPSEVIVDVPISGSFNDWLANKVRFVGVLQIGLLILFVIIGLKGAATNCIVVKVSN